MSAVVTAPHTTVEGVVRAELLRALGGWRGALEAALPIIAFLVAIRTWPTGSDEQALRPALVVGGAVMALVVALRVVQRQTLQYAFAGVFGLVLAAVFALATGDPKAIALPGILYNAVLGVAYLVSIIIGWPAVGFLYGAVRQDLTGWRREPGVVPLFQKITAVLLLNYVLRVAVLLPLYLASAPLEVQLGFKLALGWPMLGVSVVVIGVILARGHTPLPAQPVPAASAVGDAEAEPA